MTPHSPQSPPSNGSALDWSEDGAPRSRLFDDVYFSMVDGLAESRAVFLAGCGLPDAWATRDRFVVGELGFGTGLNILALLEGQKEPEGGKHIKVPLAPSTDGEWFDYLIKVEGKHITLSVNGKTTVDFVEPEGWDPVKELKNMPGRKLSEGTFAIQGHDPKSTTYYKDIFVKALP